MRERIRWAAATAIVVMALIVVSVATAGDPGPVVHETAIDPVPVHAVPASQKAMLGLFRRDRRPTDQIVANEEGLALAAADAVPGENLGLSREASDGRKGGPIYMWPASDDVCYSLEGGSGCVPTNALDELGVAPSTSTLPEIGDGVTRVAGPVRDGIMSVDVVTDDSTVTVDVKNNFFLVDVRGRAREVVWSEDGTEHRLPLAGSP